MKFIVGSMISHKHTHTPAGSSPLFYITGKIGNRTAGTEKREKNSKTENLKFFKKFISNQQQRIYGSATATTLTKNICPPIYWWANK